MLLNIFGGENLHDRKINLIFPSKTIFLLILFLFWLLFTNILQTAILPISFQQKIANTNCKYRKATHNTFVQKKELITCWWNWQIDYFSPFSGQLWTSDERGNFSNKHFFLFDITLKFIATDRVYYRLRFWTFVK